MPAAHQPTSDSDVIIGEDPLAGQHTFRSHELEHAREYVCGLVSGYRPHRFLNERHVELHYLPQERYLDFVHRQALLGPIGVHLMQYGGGVMLNAKPYNEIYLLQLALSGWCQIRQEKRSITLPAGSIALLNPSLPFAKTFMPGYRQLHITIDKRLVEREFRAWTGNDEAVPLEFDLAPISDPARVGTLTRYMRMLCDDLRNDTSHLTHPLVQDRIASGLVSLLLTAIPHNRMRAVESAMAPIAPRFVRRVEQFIEQHASEALALNDLTRVAGVSTRALQMGFRQFRHTTPMNYLRAVRLELARRELVRAAREGGSVAEVANAVGLAHLGRFARDYKARFGEGPSQTLSRTI